MCRLLAYSCKAPQAVERPFCELAGFRQLSHLHRGDSL
jgi:predicted glutamine amidotransferase